MATAISASYLIDLFLWGYITEQVFKSPLANVDEIRERKPHEFAAL